MWKFFDFLGFDGIIVLCRVVIVVNKLINLIDILSGIFFNCVDNFIGVKVNSNVNLMSFFIIYLDISVNYCNFDIVFKVLELSNGVV